MGEQLQRAHDAQMGQAHQIKQLQLREKLRAERGELQTNGEIERAADREMDSRARAELGLLLICQVRPHPSRRR